VNVLQLIWHFFPIHGIVVVVAAAACCFDPAGRLARQEFHSVRRQRNLVEEKKKNKSAAEASAEKTNSWKKKLRFKRFLISFFTLKEDKSKGGGFLN
jgi:hypothetical protein